MRGAARVFGASRLSDSLRTICVVEATYALPIAFTSTLPCATRGRSALGPRRSRKWPHRQRLWRAHRNQAQAREDCLAWRIPCRSPPDQRLRCAGFSCTYKDRKLVHRRPIGRIPEEHPPGFDRHPRSPPDGAEPCRRAAAKRSLSCIFSPARRITAQAQRRQGCTALRRHGRALSMCTR